jgi:hypothetical protein
MGVVKMIDGKKKTSLGRPMPVDMFDVTVSDRDKVTHLNWKLDDVEEEASEWRAYIVAIGIELGVPTEPLPKDGSKWPLPDKVLAAAKGVKGVQMWLPKALERVSELEARVSELKTAYAESLEEVEYWAKRAYRPVV